MSNILLTPYDGAILGPIAKILGVIMDAIYMFMFNIFGIENVGLSIILFTIVIYTLMHYEDKDSTRRAKCQISTNECKETSIFSFMPATPPPIRLFFSRFFSCSTACVSIATCEVGQ